MKYIYNGVESNDEYVIDELIWNKLSEQNPFPNEADVEEEWNTQVEKVEE